MKISLLEWNVTYTELARWAVNTGAKVHAVAGTSYIYEMDDTDFTAFKITFTQGTTLAYKAAQVVDSGYYYCPYIPIINPTIAIKITAV